MSTYIYRRAASNSARALAEILDAVRWQATRTRIEQKARPGDVVVCWGEHCPDLNGVRVLNGARLQDKLADALMLQQAGVPTITTSLTLPPPMPLTDPAIALWEQAQQQGINFVDLGFARTSSARETVAALARVVLDLQHALIQPIPTAQDEWLGRMKHHVGGNDLLNPPTTPDFYVRKENIVEEVRIHSFCGKSIRAGKKIHRQDFDGERSTWIRSMDAGWRLSYDGVSAQQRHRDLAHRAITALGLDFGAVDIAELANGDLIVLEVNRAPGLGEGTAERYASAITRWINGEFASAEEVD